MIFWGTFFVTQISQMTQIFFVGVFLSHRFHRFPQIFLWNLFVLSQGDICNDRTGRLREIPCRPMMKKICVICEICVTKKTSQEKSVYICEICGTFYTLREYLFFVGLFCPTDFTDIHRFFMESQVNRFVRSQGVSATTEQVASAKFRE